MLWHIFPNMNYIPGQTICRRHWLFFQSAHYRGLSLQHQTLLPIDSADVFPLGLSPLVTAMPAMLPPSPSLPTSRLLPMLDSAEEVNHSLKQQIGVMKSANHINSVCCCQFAVVIHLFVMQHRWNVEQSDAGGLSPHLHVDPYLLHLVRFFIMSERLSSPHQIILTDCPK